MQLARRVILGPSWLSLVLLILVWSSPSVRSAPDRAPTTAPGTSSRRPAAKPPGSTSAESQRPDKTGRAARPTATCEVLVIQGLDQAGPFPKALVPLRSRLASRPFSRFRSFQLLGNRSLALVPGERRRAPMVGTYVLEAELLSRVVSAKGPERLRFALTLERLLDRQRPAKRVLRSVLVLDRGGTLFLAGPRHERGTLVFGLTCR